MKDALDSPRGKGSRLSSTGIWFAVGGTVLAAVSGIGARADLLSPFAGMGAFALGSLLLLIAAITAGLGLWRSGGTAGGASRVATWLALLAGLAVTANNALVIGQARGAPAIHDISTDTVNPPQFVALIPLRGEGSNPPEYAGAEAAAVQQRAFPDIAPLVTSQPPDVVFARARDVVARQGWQVAAASEEDGRIEATAETQWVRFKDDVVIRITSNGAETRVDVRSKSRVGRGDMGANARRVRTFLSALKAGLAS